jgi:phospholipase/carboxylesterase
VIEEATGANRNTPIFIAHGSEDDVMAPELGMLARDFLQQHGYAFQWREYPMPHSICLEEMQDMGAWLNERISAP